MTKIISYYFIILSIGFLSCKTSSEINNDQNEMYNEIIRKKIDSIKSEAVILQSTTSKSVNQDSAKIYGKVYGINKIDTITLIGSTIFFKNNPKFGTVSNFEGDYELMIDHSFNHLMCEYIGYISLDTVINIRGKGLINLDVYLFQSIPIPCNVEYKRPKNWITRVYHKIRYKLKNIAK